MAIAWAPPTAYTSSTPSSAQAARIVGCGRPVSRCGDDVSAIEPTPATWAGTTFIDHAGHQRRDAAGDVEADPLDRDHPLRDRAAGHDLGDLVVLQLGLAGAPQPGDRLLQAGTHGGVEAVQRLGQGGRRHRDVGLLDLVELRAELDDRLDPAMAHGVADRTHDVEGGLDVELCARHHGAVVSGLAAPEVDSADHALQSKGARSARSGPADTRTDPCRAGQM